MKKNSATSAKTTFISFLLDETGSMEPIKDDTLGGFNEYVKTLQKSEGEILFSLVSFNSSKTLKRYVAEPIADVKRLEEEDYAPNASTPLIDAAVKIIKATDEAVQRRGDDTNVVVVMQTDGEENVSVEYDSADLAALVKEKEAAGWEFVFLGAGMDAFQAARAAGVNIDADRVMSYGRNLSAPAFEHMAHNLSEYAAKGVREVLDFSASQREEAGDEFHDRRASKPAKKWVRRGKKIARGGTDPVRSTVDDIEL